MELLTKAQNTTTGKKTQYRMKTKKLCYRLSSTVDQFKWLFKREVTPKAYILKNVDFEARPGEITAIAGASGAGKTTLLEIVAANECSTFSESIRLVTQEEALFPLLTVEETLLYSARLRFHGGHQKATARVSELLRELGLQHVANVRIGSESNRGISGGEKRKVSIGVDLVHDPAVLLLDEPTSGLDSSSALDVALLLKTMASTQGKTMFLTIHQPGFRILELIDQILLLSNGTVIHNGPLHILEQRLRYAGHSIPLQVNVLEFAIEVMEDLIIHVEESEIEYGEIEGEFKHVRPNSIIGNVYEDRVLYANPLFKEGICAGYYIFMNAANDPRRAKLQTQIGFFAFSLTFLMSSATEGLPIYLQERRILMRETSRGAYRISSYVISNTLVFLPFLLGVALLYATPVYWLVGLRREIDGFLYFSLVVWMVILMSNSLVACFSALVPNFIMGTSLVAGLMGSFFLFSGFFIPKEDIPSYWTFMHYLSLFKYPLECFLINEYGGEQGRRRCLQSVGGDCILYGDWFLMQQGLKPSQKWINLGIMLGFIIGYRWLGFLILWYRSYRISK
ncbi:ABC transporter G family member 10 [Prunus yedoensis var. nudiflora]|uniref:ABC transporter G family member 10 n=1 Tax=Prunus yedoensis var. nudiflora TaxID=2094558 RepID=A0A314UCK6_PRUYE|nr:ABC transporter G family member 10 [Prunus yedoensis var. nudiflora]